MDLLTIAKEQNKEQKEITQQQQSPLYSFMYALKSSEARRQYPKRLKLLFDYLKLSGSLQEQAVEFLNKAKQQENGAQWAQYSIMAFLDFHKERVRHKELAAGTLKTTIELLNYFVK